MKITSYLSAIVGATALASNSVEAALITYQFVPSATPAFGGGVFTAQASFDDGLIGAGLQVASPTKFSAGLSGNSLYADRTWELEEINLSVFEISSSAALTYAILLGQDTASVQSGFGSTLMAGVGAFVSPVFVPGSWQLISSTPSEEVPEGGPGAFAAVVVVGMGIVAHRNRRKRQTA